MIFDEQYKDLKVEKYTNKQIAGFMGISIRSFYYYKSKTYAPKYTKKRFKKTYINVVRYEQKEKNKAKKKLEEYKAKKKLEEYKDKPISEKLPILHGFDKETVRNKLKKYPKKYDVIYYLWYEYTIVHKDTRRELKGDFTYHYFNPSHAILEMQRILESISASVDVYLTNTEWHYETQLLISAY